MTKLQRRSWAWVLALSVAALASPGGLSTARAADDENTRVRITASGAPEFNFNNQEPQLVSVTGTNVMYARDFPDADVYRVGTNTWYAFYNNNWYQADSYRGPWAREEVTTVPGNVVTVPSSFRRFDRMGTGISTPSTGTVNPTDIDITTEPRMVIVQGTTVAPNIDVYYAPEFQEGDLYRVGSTWYVFHNSTWYRATGFRGPWTFVETTSVPHELISVPSGFSRFSHTTVTNTMGNETTTPGGTLGAMGTNTTGTTTTNTNLSGTGPSFSLTREPRMVRVPRSRVFYAQGFNEGDLYRVGSTWYVFHDNNWYRSNTYTGPWTLTGATHVPREVVVVPSGYYHFNREGARMAQTGIGTTRTSMTSRRHTRSYTGSTLETHTRHAARHYQAHRMTKHHRRTTTHTTTSTSRSDTTTR